MTALIPTIVPISDAKPRLAALIDQSDTEDIVLTRRGRVAAILQSRDEPAEAAEQVYARIVL